MPHKTTASLTLALIAALMVSLLALTVLTTPALAHVRDKDKARMCGGYHSAMRHFHSVGVGGYYFHTQLRYRSNGYAHYKTWKTNRFAVPYDRHKKVVNCRNFASVNSNQAHRHYAFDEDVATRHYAFETPQG